MSIVTEKKRKTIKCKVSDKTSFISQKTMDEAKLVAEQTKLVDELTTLARDRGYGVDDEDGADRSYDNADAVDENDGILPAGFADREDVAIGGLSRRRRDVSCPLVSF